MQLFARALPLSRSLPRPAMSTLLSNKLSLSDIKPEQVAGKRVLVRVDFNVPLKHEAGRGATITDDSRITATLPTLQALQALKPAAIVLISHLGRPDGSVVPKYSLAPVATHLAGLLGSSVTLLTENISTDCEAIRNKLSAASDGQVFMLENIRFSPFEEGKSVVDGKKLTASKEDIKTFCDALSSFGDIYINDAFGAAHRAHSSVVGVSLPIRAAGLLMERELRYFSKVLEGPQRPLVAILGGSKVSDKIQLIMHLLDLVDSLIIGGAMAFAFKKTIENVKIGNSLFDEESASLCQQIIDRAKERGVTIHLPVDYVTADRFAPDATVGHATDASGIPDGMMGLDIGSESAENFAKAIRTAKTVVWNGPAGVFEFDAFAKGSSVIADAVVAATADGATSIVCGGDTITAAAKFGLTEKFSHVSTGGGASLELLSGIQLPGVVALSSKSD
ncbi:phosphoglycerate kinase [Fonticula alba]|uniref:Phosphoglycerate kinase n=1 Tax=Fonticula alba TaxID=691883 RepID=A0A058Z2Q6_FONAL|nr:phosphoglycerate kinase [Fonticula alba]KCV68554.1 phosphoglycerate kinase [Fonticula alba]|eukprot:XP_009496986.1 phosphoglycerate kinase [Fonticula alba]